MTGGTDSTKGRHGDTYPQLGYEGVIKALSYPGWEFQCGHDGEGGPWLRIKCEEGVCNVTGKPMRWYSRKWRLSAHMTDGEVVQTAFMAVLAALEHEARENFKFIGVAVLQPHYDIYKLMALAQDPQATRERDHLP